jgi:hypothetical protein
MENDQSNFREILNLFVLFRNSENPNLNYAFNVRKQYK